MAFGEAIKNIGKRVYDKKTDTQSKWTGLSVDEKLQAISNWVGMTDREQRIRRNTTFYLQSLYYQGYQSVDVNPDGNAFDVYEREDFYIENQFRRHVDAVVNMLSKAEGDLVVRPQAYNPRDIAKARAAGPILDMMKSTIGYPQMQHLKNLYKALYGNAFIFTDYVVDKKYGQITAPKYDYKELPGEDGGDPMLSKVVSGYETRNKGSEIGTVCSPLEVHVRPDTKGFENIPWLRWEMRRDIEVINYVYPGLKLTGGSNAIDNDLSQQYLEVLSNLPGNLLGDSLAYNRGNSQVRKVVLARNWLQPCMFDGDKELEKKFPDGVHVVTVDGSIVEYYAENLLDRWNHEVLIPVPASLLGDGLYDLLLMQDQLNEMNTLIIQHERYSTVGHKLYDALMIDPKDVVNDPKNGWIPVRPTLDKNVSMAVQHVQPNQLSQDVPAWVQSLKSAMQDMSSAYDPSQGKGIGANTPYSQSVFLAEKAASRWKGSTDYNEPELIRFHKNLLGIAANNWDDERKRAVSDNTGSWTFEQFSKLDLRGDVDISMTNTDMAPKSRAEQIQGLQMFAELMPVMPTLSEKQKLRVEEVLGLPPDSNPVTTQIARAYRHIDRIKNGETVTPLPFVDNPQAQVPVFSEYLAGEDGEDLAISDPPTFSNIYVFMMHLIAMSQGQPMTPATHKGTPPGGQGAAPQGEPPGTPGGQPGQQGGGPSPDNTAQTPVKPAPPISPPAPA